MSIWGPANSVPSNKEIGHIFNMASSLKQFACVLFMLIFASLSVEARQSKFFSRVMLSNSIEKGSSPLLETPIGAPVPGPAAAPAPVSGGDDGFPPVPFESGIGFVPASAPSPVPAPAFFESDNPYGLYGAGGDEESEINPNVEFSSSYEGTEIPNDHKFSNERLTEFNTEKPINNNNNYYNSNYNNNGYFNNYYSNNNNGYSSSNFYSNGYTNAYNGNGNGYESSERQGMSDTRFLENGKYSYDPNNENYNYQNNNEPEKGSNSNGGYYGEKSRYEFDSMEEYERQRGYP